ncbi:MAG: 1-acyl-sn-glycerol-3-phosphate acyltransferase [Clostridia bacterium]|nr:1-acyl-sn-glycerol-3-phosphate acyltransferase [Clostridia bacterium]
MKKDKKNKKKNKQNIFLYRLVRFLAWFVAIFAFRRKFIRNEIKGKKGPFVIIANHEAALDFVNLIGATRTPLSFVISNSFYNTLPFKSVVSRLGMIPKQQFQTSLRDLGAMRSTIREGKILVIYPAGLMCEDGQSTPIPAATYEFLKWLNTDVYVAKTIGTYFSMPKWAKGIRVGRTFIDIYKLFDKDALREMPLEEVKEKTSEALDFDAYLEQEKLKIKYRKNDNIEGLENVLYVCPNCMGEFTMRTKKKKTIYCVQCGFEETSDKYAFLHNKKGVGKEVRHVSAWSRMIYESLKEKVEEGKIKKLTTMARVQTIDPKKHKYRNAGRARITLTPDTLSIKGNINGEDIDLAMPTSAFPSLPFKPGRNFEIQHGDISYRCFPQKPLVVMKWVNLVKIYYEIKTAEKAQEAEAKVK